MIMVYKTDGSRIPIYIVFQSRQTQAIEVAAQYHEGYDLSMRFLKETLSFRNVLWDTCVHLEEIEAKALCLLR